MICVICGKRMSVMGAYSYNCPKCGVTVKQNDGGAISYYDSEGEIFYPPNNVTKKDIAEIEKQIKEVFGKE